MHILILQHLELILLSYNKTVAGAIKYHCRAMGRCWASPPTKKADDYIIDRFVVGDDHIAQILFFHQFILFSLQSKPSLNLFKQLDGFEFKDVFRGVRCDELDLLVGELFERFFIIGRRCHA